MSEPIVPRLFHGMPLSDQQDILLQRSLRALALTPKLIEALNQRRREYEADEKIASADRVD